MSLKTVHKWLRRYGAEGLKGLADRLSKPESCPHQMLPGVEARVVEMRREHPGWGAADHPHPSRTGGGDVAAGSQLDPWGPVASRADRSHHASAAPVGVQAVGAVPLDGVVADGHGGSVPPGRWQRGEGRHRRG